MQTTCVRCHKTIDTVQGYKFSPTEYVCMSCYDEFRAERGLYRDFERDAMHADDSEKIFDDDDMWRVYDADI